MEVVKTFFYAEKKIFPQQNKYLQWFNNFDSFVSLKLDSLK